MLSFYAPYLCDSCRTPFQAVIDAYVHKAAVAARTPPVLQCPNCGSDARYDGTAEAFAAAAEKVEPRPEPSRAAAPQGGPHLERSDEDGSTRFALVGELTTSLRWRSSLEESEGPVTLDLTQAVGVGPGAIAPLLSALREAAPHTAGVTLLGAPIPLAQALRLGPVAQVKLHSVAVDGACPKCAQPRRGVVSLVGGRWEEPVARGVKCPVCDSRLAVAKVLDDVPQRSLPFGWIIGAGVGLTGIALVLVVVGLALMSDWRGASAGGDLPEAKDLPSERVVMGDDLVATGARGGPAPTRSEAEKAARQKAANLIVSALAREIMTRRGSSGSTLDVTPAQVRTFLEVTGTADELTSLDEVVEDEASGGIVVSGKYGLPRKRFDELAAEYAEEKPWAGLVLVRPFPPAPGLRVVRSDVAGVEPGTRIVKVAGTKVDFLSQMPASGAGATLTLQDNDGAEREVTVP